MRYLYAIIVVMVLAVVWQGWTYRQAWNYLETESSAQAYGATPDKAKVTIIAFMNYASRPSKDLYSTVLQVVQAQPDVRIIFHMLPSSSDTAYRSTAIALAASLQNKFMDMSIELMRHEGPLSDDDVRAIAKNIKADPDLLLKDAGGAKVRSMLAHEIAAASAMKIELSPLFMMNRKILMGPDSYETFQDDFTQTIEKARKL